MTDAKRLEEANAQAQSEFNAAFEEFRRAAVKLNEPGLNAESWALAQGMVKRLREQQPDEDGNERIVFAHPLSDADRSHIAAYVTQGNVVAKVTNDIKTVLVMKAAS